MTMTKMDTLRNYKYRSSEDIRRMNEAFGQRRFARFRETVKEFLKEMEPNRWIDFRTFVDPESFEPFVISACLHMLDHNTLIEYWEFNDDYTRIRRVTDIPGKQPLYASYEKKQDYRSTMPG